LYFFSYPPTATTEIYTLSLHDALPICLLDKGRMKLSLEGLGMEPDLRETFGELIRIPHGIVLVTGPTGSGKTTTLYSSLLEKVSDRKSTRLNSSHSQISYAVFCLKKKK